MRTDQHQKEIEFLQKRLSSCEQTLYEVQELLNEQRCWLDQVSDEKSYKLAHLWMRIYHQMRSGSYERRLFWRWLKKQPVEESRFNYIYQLQRTRDAAASLLDSVRRDPDRELDPQEKAYQSFRNKRQYKLQLQNLAFSQVPGLVSIVLPVYNGGALLDQAIQSVLTQTYKKFELIIVDDGSQDDTPARVDQWALKDGRIHVVHQENQKIPRALNHGFRLAKGEFLTWTSADNVMHTDFLERMVEFLQRNQNVALCYANMRLIDEEDTPIRNNRWFPQKDEPEVVDFPPAELRLNAHSENLIGAAFMYRRIVKELIGGYDPNLYTVEDYDYWLRINDFFSIRHVDFSDAIYDYRLHKKSLTARSKELHIHEMKTRLMCIEHARQAALLSPLCWLIGPGEGADRWKEMALAHGDAVITDNAHFPPERCVAVSFGISPGADTQTDVAYVKVETGQTSTEPYQENFYIQVGEGNTPLQCEVRATDWETAFQAAHLWAKARWTIQLSNPLPSQQLKASFVLHERENVTTEEMERTLQSVLEQSVSRSVYEILVIAKENSHFAEALIGQQNVRTLYLPSDKAEQIWNAALYHAQGEYLIFATGDTTFSNDVLRFLAQDFHDDRYAAMIFGKLPKGCLSYERFPKYDVSLQTTAFSVRRESLWEIGGFRETADSEPEISLQRTSQDLQNMGYTIGGDPRIL